MRFVTPGWSDHMRFDVDGVDRAVTAVELYRETTIGAVCHDIPEFCARVLAILAEPSRQLPSAHLLGRWGWS